MNSSERKTAESQTCTTRHRAPNVSVSEEHEVVALRAELAKAKRREALLATALERAESSVRAKGDFLAHMSHELRSPMTAVIGMSELLMETPLSGEQRDMVSTVRRSAGALVSLVNDILDYSKIETGKLQVEHRRFDLRECVEECLDLMAPNVQDKPVELLYEMVPGTPEIIMGDGNRVRQVLVNLVSNAIKFTSAGEVAVEISSQSIDQGRSEIRIGVRDTGIGIASEKLDSLFQEYVQADASTTRKYGGTGLGLSISRGLVELMDGTMRVDSEPGHGSTFYFTFTCDVCPEVGSVPHGAQDCLTGRRLLVVERNDTSRAQLTRLAHAWGMEVVETGDPCIALRHLEDHSGFDVALVDRQVRDEADNDLCSRMQSIAPHVPIVLLTSLSGTANQSAQAVGGGTAPVSYVSRPMKPKRLLHALSVSVDRHPSETSQQASSRMTKAVDLKLGEKLDISILIADDELTIQRVARKFLEKMGFDAEIVSNGQELLDALYRRSFDVVLVDFNMPVMGGLEAASRIRQEFSAETAPYLIAMTGAVMDDDSTCFAQGIDDVLPKPWGPHDLQKTLEDAASIIHWRRERMLVAS